MYLLCLRWNYATKILLYHYNSSLGFTHSSVLLLLNYNNIFMFAILAQHKVNIFVLNSLYNVIFNIVFLIMCIFCYIDHIYVSHIYDAVKFIIYVYMSAKSVKLNQLKSFLCWFIVDSQTYGKQYQTFYYVFFFVQDCDEDVVTAIMNAKTGIIS